VSIISPIFVYILLTRISGVPMLEKVRGELEKGGRRGEERGEEKGGEAGSNSLIYFYSDCGRKMGKQR
jgi:hypothetical protein